VIVETKVSGAYAKFLRRSLELNSRLGSRISTAKLDILGEEYWPEEVKTIYDKGYALEFYGTNERITTPTLLDTAPADGTVEFWFSLPSTFDSLSPASMIPWAKINDAAGTIDYVYAILRNADGKMRYNIQIASVNYAANTTRNSWPAGWYYVAFVWGSNGMKIYVNGSEDGANAQTNPWGNGADRDFILGCSNFAGFTDDFIGYIDELRVSDKIRTQDEITEAWNGGAGKRFEVDANTLCLWHMDEGSGGTVFDETTNNHDGTITGADWVTGFVPRPIRTISAPGLSACPFVGFGGYTHPYVKEDLVIDRAKWPFVSCYAGAKVGLCGNSSYIDHFFGGTVATKEIRLIGKRRIYRITGQDYNVDPTTKLVTKNYVLQTEQQIIDDLFGTYLPDIDTSTTYVESSGATISLNWTRESLDAAMDELAGIFEKDWYIDHEKKLHYFTPTTGTAPFALCSSPWCSTHIGYDRLSYLENARELHNRVTVVGDTTVPVVETQSDAASAAIYGWYDWKIVDPNIDTAVWAQLRGDAELALSAWPKVAGQLTLHQEGLIIGQKVYIYNHSRNINGYYTIQKLMMKLLNNTTEEITIDYGDYSPDMIDLLLAIDKEAKKEA